MFSKELGQINMLAKGLTGKYDVGEDKGFDSIRVDAHS